MSNAGVNLTKFKADSCQSAFTSKVRVMGISLENGKYIEEMSVIKQSTWKKHYYKHLVKEFRECQATVLQTKDELKAVFQYRRD